MRAVWFGCWGAAVVVALYTLASGRGVWWVSLCAVLQLLLLFRLVLRPSSLE